MVNTPDGKLPILKPLTPAQMVEAAEIARAEEYLLRKHARASAVDNGDGAHGGGMGSSGSAVDFGRPKNYTF